MDIVVTGYAGLEGSIAIYQDESLGARVKARYPESFFRASKFGSNAETSATQLDLFYASYALQGLATDGSDGGVLAALWRVLKNNHKGGRYALRAIPLMQQTVEVCEMYALNPYRLYAPGCRVWLCTDTAALKSAAAAAGVPLSVMGFTSKGVAIKRTDTDADSSLRRPEGDELDKVMSRGKLDKALC